MRKLVVAVLLLWPTLAAHAQGTLSGLELPVADYAAALPTEEPARSLRMARNAWFNNPRGPVIPTHKETSSVTWTDRVRKEEAPYRASDAIVVGTVETGEAFLSEDRRALYSEFLLRVETVLKDVNTTKRMGLLQVGDRIAILRRGGALRVASGELTKEFWRPDNLPQVGHAYVLFLKRVPDIEGFSIVTGYRIKENEIAPLDNGSEYPEYDGMALDSFLALVRRMVGDAGSN